MKATQILHELGLSLWLDSITRDSSDKGTLKPYIDEFSMTGLTPIPSIFDHAINNGNGYDSSISEKFTEGKTSEQLFFDLALDDLTRASDLFRPIRDRANGVDGWECLEVSPLLGYDTDRTIAAKDLSSQTSNLHFPCERKWHAHHLST